MVNYTCICISTKILLESDMFRINGVAIEFESAREGANKVKKCSNKVV